MIGGNTIKELIESLRTNCENGIKFMIQNLKALKILFYLNLPNIDKTS